MPKRKKSLVGWIRGCYTLGFHPETGTLNLISPYTSLETTLTRYKNQCPYDHYHYKKDKPVKVRITIEEI